jgi:NAD(P)-dependent dehydrogenase (short-subunit alcohol dehydrogenase family)
MVRDKAATDAKVAAELPGRSNIHIVQADLDDLASLQKTVPTVSKIVNGALDYIIANAGLVSSYSAYDGFGHLQVTPLCPHCSV